MWLPEPAKWQVWAKLLSCGHIMWWIETMTIDEAAAKSGFSPCFQCRYRNEEGRLVLPKRAYYALRPAFRTYREKDDAWAAGLLRHPRWC